MDRRLTPFSGRVALPALRGAVPAEVFADGTAASVCKPLVDLLSRPNGARDRQLLWGDAVTVIDRQDGHVFVQAEKDGYCGWLVEGAVSDRVVPTHWVAARSSHLYSGARVQAPDNHAMPFGARIKVLGLVGSFAETAQGYVPKSHVRALGDRPKDPVAVAEMFLGAPYLWGGNSAAGLDCSGLVQMAYLACGLPCPADSDQQRAIGTPLGHEDALARGDLIFWKGHVAIVTGADYLIHANGHTMTVAYEGILDCISRIAAQDGGPVLERRRP